MEPQLSGSQSGVSFPAPHPGDTWQRLEPFWVVTTLGDGGCWCEVGWGGSWDAAGGPAVHGAAATREHDLAPNVTGAKVQEPGPQHRSSA